MASARTTALMLQGTGSHVGKSLLVAGLCRAYARRGLRVRPFKPQNMSNNAAVTADGGEIGRAQALQARACGVAPSVDMNPVLLKPQSETGAQVVVRGKVFATVSAREYGAVKAGLMGVVLESFRKVGGGGRSRAGRGGGEPGGGQSAGERYCEHGVCGGCGSAGGAGRRHRAGWGDRGAGRDACAAGGKRAGAAQGVSGQQVPGRSAAVRWGASGDPGAHGHAEVWRRAVVRRRRGSCRPRMGSGSRSGAATGRLVR